MRLKAMLLWLTLASAMSCHDTRAVNPVPNAPLTATQPDPTPVAVSVTPPAPSFVSNEPIAPISAPFPMPNLARPEFPARSFDVRDYGADEKGVALSTQAFRDAVKAAVSAGGGTVLVPKGNYLTGPIHLGSNVNLHLAEGAVLAFSQNFADYLPVVFTRWEGLEVYNYSPLIYAKDCQNVAVTGSGKLDGRGAAWWPWKKTQKEAAKRLYELASRGVPPAERIFGTEGGLRPSFIQTVNCKNVLIEGVTITNGPMWTIHPVYSENVIVRRVRVQTEGPNNDGFNPDSTRNVLIEDSFFSTGDDCVVIKAGLNEDGWRVGKPSENIVVRRLRGELGHGGVVIGSEMSGGVRNVAVEDCDFTGTDRGLRIKSMRGRGGFVENIYYNNVRHRDLRLMVVEVTSFYASSTLEPLSQKPPRIRGIHVSNVTAQGAKFAAQITGLPEAPIEDVTFDRVDIQADEGVRCTDTKGMRFTGTKITPKTGAPFRFESTAGASVDGSCEGRPEACVQLGKKNTAVSVDGQSQPAKRR
jgi:polygalacturonase